MTESVLRRVWLTADEATQVTGVSRTEIYAALQSKELVGYQRTKNGKWRIHVDDSDRWMRS